MVRAIGAAAVPDLNSARAFLEQAKPAVVVMASEAKTNIELARYLQSTVPKAQWLVVERDYTRDQILELANSGCLFDFVSTLEDPALVEKLQSAMEYSGQLAQQTQLDSLIVEQAAHHSRQQAELEQRVEKRQKTLRRSKKTLDQTRQRLDAFHRVLLGINRATSVMQIETAVQESLNPLFPGISARIRFSSQSAMPHVPIPNIFSIEIPFQDIHLRGEIHFSGESIKTLSRPSQDFLVEVTEAIAFGLTRLNKLELAGSLKGQWQATFDSIPHPLCLTNSEFEIVKLNRAFQKSCEGRSFRNLIGQNCFRAFFGEEWKSSVSHKPPFLFRSTRSGAPMTEHFEVSGHALGAGSKPSAFLVLLRSVTEEVRFERRISQAAKLAELGTIGSSIAHELNNPLGGVLSFLQLILMDLPKDHPHYSDIKAMEAATHRCRDIIQNLLSFARKQDPGELVPVRVMEVVEKSIRLMELQSRSKGIHLDVQVTDDFLIRGNVTTLTQAVCNLLQNAVDSLTERMSGQSLYQGRIQLTSQSSGDQVMLRISDNGMGISPTVQSRIFNPHFTTRDPGLFSGMGLTTAYTIISDHDGSLEILSQTGSGTTAIVSLPRLDQSLESAGF